MMLDFLRWCWHSWEWWQRFIVTSLVLNLSALFFDRPVSTWLSGVGLAVLAVWVVHFWYTSVFLAKWAKYKDHRNQLLTIIKDSDHERNR